MVLERFFDEAGGMQLVIHSPYGSRINRAWGLALRKRFCRKFNFELQAAATEDNIVLSLTTAHSFELADVPRYLQFGDACGAVLIQALLDAPMFITRWRWVAGGLARAAALPRRQQGAAAARAHGRRGPDRARSSPTRSPAPRTSPASARFPDHPLVRQTIADCLTEAMDIAGLERLLAGLEVGRHPRRHARPDRSPRRSRSRCCRRGPMPISTTRRSRSAAPRRSWPALARARAASDLGRLDPEAIARVRVEAWPDAANADELHDALVWLGFLTEAEVEA